MLLLQGAAAPATRAAGADPSQLRAGAAGSPSPPGNLPAELWEASHRGEPIRKYGCSRYTRAVYLKLIKGWSK